MPPSLTIIRGVPGSGKSTLAEMLRQAAMRTVASSADVPMIVEMDDWRKTSDGQYVYNADENRRLAVLCYKRVDDLLDHGNSVIVSNTSLRRVHVEPYKRLASKYRIPYVEYICNNQFGSIHGVDPRIVQAMQLQLEL